MKQSIGCDIVEIERMNKIIKYEHIPFFSSKELALYNMVSNSRKREYLAGRFAAKEAIFKAINELLPITIVDIEIFNKDNGMPYCEIAGFDISLSISHEKAYAIAYALVCPI